MGFACITDHSIQVSWSPPKVTNADLTGEVTNFLIQYDKMHTT